ncbi:Inner membrane protein YibH [Shimia sp. SK013]|uniref:HlyD family secretion protein n=1 Tax=Shimia sp. SK013 TaxID=1389006 RepID=UPI0006B58EB1|nr:biotin/lipoyl-binding protein [Shimia sp. SK013]KPA21958.1 Inner membrane protein YibH [Shimia sp. SK013]
MIVFLTLAYVAVLFVLIKMKVLPNTKATWMSTIVWFVALFIFLFIPMQWGAPSGPVRVMTRVVQVIPNVSGQVTAVHAQANVPLKEGDLLFELDPEPFQIAVDLAEASKARVLAQAEQDIDNLKAAEAQLDQAQARQVFAARRYEDDAKLVETDTISESRLEQRQADLDTANGAVAAAAAAVSQAETELGAVTKDGVIAKVAEADAQLEQALWNLEQTKVLAPSDGFVTNLALAAGQRVTSLPLAPAMAFVDTSEKALVAQVHQIYKRHIKPGQKVEIAMKTKPGQLLTGEVELLLDVSSQGQAIVSGTVLSSQQIVAEPFLLRIKLDSPEVLSSMAPGAAGMVAIYTESVGATHVIRKVMLRMTSIMNYVKIGL